MYILCTQSIGEIMVSERQHEVMKGFFEVPGWPLLYINENGIAWDEYFKEYVRPERGSFPYLQLQPQGSIKPISLHRAIALTFIDCPGDPSDFQIDHVDGDKENYAKENLEWVSRSENALRAFRNGQRHDNRPIMVKNLETDVVMRYHGINACGRALGFHPAYISSYLKRPQSIPFKEKYEVIREGTKWRGFTKADIGKHNGNRPKEVVAVSVETGDAVIYGSCARASECTGATQSEISNRAATKSDDPVKGFKFIYLKDFIGSIEKLVRIESKRVTNFDGRRYKKKPTPIEVYDTLRKTTTTWDSTDSFANHIGVHKKTVQKSMNANDGVFKGYQIRYVKE